MRLYKFKIVIVASILTIIGFLLAYHSYEQAFLGNNPRSYEHKFGGDATLSYERERLWNSPALEKPVFSDCG